MPQVPKMEQFVTELRTHFDALSGKLATFAMNGVQVEGWFKGEMLCALGRLKNDGCVIAYDREVRFEEFSRRKIDLCVDTMSGRHWIELKYWLIGNQKAVSYLPRNYFQDGTSVGIIADVQKLREVRGEGRCWLLICCAANPGQSAWDAGVETFTSRFGSFIRSSSDCACWPASHYLGLLEVVRPD
jgi:hypothetical protein